MADFRIASMQGAMLMGKIKSSSQTVETTVQEAFAHLKSYSPWSIHAQTPLK
jgi:hypothetical protein